MVAACVTVRDGASGEPRERGGCLGAAGPLRSSEAVLTLGGGGGGEAGARLGSALGGSRGGEEKYKQIVKTYENLWFWLGLGGSGEGMGSLLGNTIDSGRVEKLIKILVS